MSEKDINKKAFDEGTLLKLKIFQECFREWFPVFLYTPGIERICIYDLFAGSGYDTEGNPGSPIILLEEARGNEYQHCSRLNQCKKLKVMFGFNEKNKKKATLLRENVERSQVSCKSKCPLRVEDCVMSRTAVASQTFDEITQSKRFNAFMQDEKTAKFLLLDQYGIKEITETVFLSLISCPKTDFIFFISSSTIRRFSNEPSIKKYFETEKIDFDNTKPKECHRLIADYYRSLIPHDKEYYLHSFTIKKDANFYGLIFGSSHSLGMEKFLKVCWKYDKYSGDSNCNLDEDHDFGILFEGSGTRHKIDAVKKEIKEAVLSGTISSNKEGLLFALKKGCLPIVFVEVIQELKKNGEIAISGVFNRQSTKIHQVPEYHITRP